MAKSTPCSASSPPKVLVTPCANRRGPGVGGRGSEALADNGLGLYGRHLRSGFLRTPWSLSPVSRPLTVQLGLALAAREEPLRPEHHHEHQGEAVNHELGALHIGGLQERET